MIAAILRVWYVLALKQGQAAAIWSCREDVIAILVGQATMIKPLFSRRFWTGQQSKSDSNSYPTKPDTDGKSGLELSSNHSRGVGSRLGLRQKPKDPYNISVLETRNESEERIVEHDGNGHAFSDIKSAPIEEQGEYAQRRATSHDQSINVKRKVDVESVKDPSYGEEHKPNYGHNSQIHSRWNAF